VVKDVVMPPITPEVSEVLEKALTLSTQDRCLLIDRLGESLRDLERINSDSDRLNSEAADVLDYQVPKE
jgi:hypothetical protein